MKVLYTSDLHGDLRLYDQIFERARDVSASIIALGGDLLSRLRAPGAYGEMIAEQRSFARERLLPLFRKALDTGAARHLLLIPGNWDMAYRELFAEPVEGIINLDRRKFPCGGVEWIGYPFVSPSPLRPKDYEKMDDLDAPWPPQKNPSYLYSDDSTPPLRAVDPHIYLQGQGTIREDLDRLPPPEDLRKTIYIMHSPPFGTRLDVIRGGVSVGSRSIRLFIERHQPLMTLHGHIHEAPEISGTYFQRIGKTLAVNPGQCGTGEGQSPRLQAVIFDTDDPARTLAHTSYA